MCSLKARFIQYYLHEINFWGDHSCENGVVIRRFRNCLCLNNQGISTLMMEVEAVSETLDHNSILTRLMAREDIIAFSLRDNFTSYIVLSLRRCLLFLIIPAIKLPELSVSLVYTCPLIRAGRTSLARNMWFSLNSAERALIQTFSPNTGSGLAP